MRVTLVQKKHTLGDKASNLRIIEETLEDVNTDLLVFPEMFLTGYQLGDQIWHESEQIPGPSSDKISKMASEQDTTIICGMPERSDPGVGRLYNSALIATPDGKVDSYRKSYLPNFALFNDKRYFVSDQEVPIFDTPLGKLGIVICYDLFLPELTKKMAMKGAEILVCISASPSVTRRFFERVMVTRAIENTCFMLYANLVGREDNVMFWGGDTIISPKGDILSKGPYFEEDHVTYSIDKKDLLSARRGRPVLDDTRTEMFKLQD